METRFFFNADGTYLGGYSGEDALSLVPTDAIEVSNPPNDARDRINSETGAIISYNPVKPLLSRLSAIVDTLPDETQAAFGNVIAPAFVALTNGKVNVARLIVLGAGVPEELQPVKDALLAEFEVVS